MGIKSFLMKKALQMKGVSAEQAEHIAKELNEHPELAASLKSLESNPEVKALFEKIQKEIEDKKKEGMNEMYAAVVVMGKYKSEIAKYRTELEPLMRLMSR
jgi:flagellar biosynthesis/type III secretory pathway protein FliH